MAKNTKNELTRRALYRQMREIEGVSIESLDDGKECLTINADFDRINLLLRIEEFVEYVKGNGETLTNFNRMSWGNEDKRPLFDALDNLQRFLSIYDKRLFYGFYVDAFYGVVKDLGWPQIESRSPDVQVNADFTLGEFFNRLIVILHQRVNTRDFKERVRKAEAESKRGIKEAKSYVSKLFRCHARLLVVRIDIRYRTEFAQHARDLLPRFNEDLRIFKRGMRRSIRHKVFDSLVGYVQAIEYGMVIGHHSHFLLFFNGDKRRNDGFLAKEIGSHWREITQQDGAWFSSNLHRETRNRPNYILGMMHRSEVISREILYNRVVVYLFKRSQLLRYRLTENQRRLFKGKAPKCVR